MRNGGTVLIRNARGNYWLVRDLWCGNGVEGECYRPHVAKLSSIEAAAIASDATLCQCQSYVFGNRKIDWRRADFNPVLRNIARTAGF